MTTAASAETTVDSATTQTEDVQQQTPAAPEFDAANANTWSKPQREHWSATGEQPTKADSATATEEDAEDDADNADSATANKNKSKSADSASDSATDKKKQKPHLRDKEETEKRFRELLDDKKKLEARLEALERGKSSTDTRDTKQESQPAAKEELKPPLPLRKFLEQFFADAKNKGKEYEEGVEAWDTAQAAFRDQETTKKIAQALQGERQQSAAKVVAESLLRQIEEMKTRYPDFDVAKLDEAAGQLMAKEVPLVVKHMLGGSKVYGDLMYVLSTDPKFADLVTLAKTDPLEAMRQIAVTESLVKEQLTKGKTGKAAAGEDKGKQRNADGTFVSSDKTKSSDGTKDAASETKPRAPKPVSEVGGRGTASEDTLASAAKAGDFKSFEAESNRRLRAQHAR
ncbi:MAG: hypothetical protein ACRD20_20495 [Terriglobales bacterium]